MTTKLDRFTQAYIGCALWSSTDDEGEPLDAAYDVSDIHPDALAVMVADCADFQSSFAELLDQAGSPEQNGHDFWLTRNRHGAGFWDRNYGAIGTKLTEMAHPYGECDIYVGDDGKLYV
jgi:hypothetical protein